MLTFFLAAPILRGYKSNWDMTKPSARYFYRNADRIEHGSCDLEDLLARIGRGEITMATEVREKGFLIWEPAYRAPVLSSAVCASRKRPRVPPVTDKPISQMAFGDLSAILDHLATRYLRWMFTVVYFPATCAMIYLFLFLLLPMNRVFAPDAASDGPAIVVLALLAWLTVVPWVLLVLHWKEKLTWQQWLLMEWGVWVIAGIGVLSLADWRFYRVVDAIEAPFRLMRFR